MSDPLSLTAGIIAVLQITGEVVSLCCRYDTLLHEGTNPIGKLLVELQDLERVLRSLRELAIRDTARLVAVKAINSPNGPLEQCKEVLEHLQKHLSAVISATGIKKFGALLSWPLKEKEVSRALEILERQKATFTLALAADQATLSVDLDSKFDAVNELLTADRTAERRKDILQSLNVGDPSSHHHEATEKRQMDTGRWFTHGMAFNDWKTRSSSFIWIYGMAGCGKTILCSTIVEELLQQFAKGSNGASAYFYFKSSDPDSRTLRSMICSLVGQLASQTPIVPKCLEELYETCREGQRQPRREDLSLVLMTIIRGFGEVYLVIDALDECTEQENLMDFFSTLKNEPLDNLHLAVASRRERDIEEAFRSYHPVEINFQKDQDVEDIRLHVKTRLAKDPKLRRLLESMKNEIEYALVDRANGMFLWVVKQLDELPCTKPAAIRRALSNLPKTLDETYERILLRIDKNEESAQDVCKVLQWLAFSARPLTLPEVAEAVAVEPSSSCFDDENQLFDPQELLSICSGLVTLSDEDPGRLRLAHHSVRQYLLSSRIQSGPTSRYALFEVSANQLIAETCLTYLLILGSPDSLTLPKAAATDSEEPTSWTKLNPCYSTVVSAQSICMVESTESAKSIYRRLPLLRYAAKYWSKHLRALPPEDAAKLDQQTLDLLNPYRSSSYVNWLRAFDPTYYGEYKFKADIGDFRPPLYYAAILGLRRITRMLLDEGADIRGHSMFSGNRKTANFRDSGVDIRVEELHGRLGPACGHKSPRDIVWRSPWRSPLHAAIERGHTAVVQELLSYGADIFGKDEHGRSPLQIASSYGRFDTLEVLVNNGADVNSQVDPESDLSAPPLQAAIRKGDKQIVELLLRLGADVNCQGGFAGNALQQAATGVDEDMVTLLIQHGANIHAQGGHYGTALQAAAVVGQLGVVNLLLAKGVDPNVRGGRWGTALQAACKSGHEELVNMLLQNGAEINAEGGLCHTALQAACDFGHWALVDLLLIRGADITRHGGSMGSAVQAASWWGNDHLIDRLLNMGAEVNCTSGTRGTPLQLAALNGNESTIRLLLARGADIKAPVCGKYGFPIQAAAVKGNISMTKLLLDVGADPSGQGGRYGNALSAATFYGHLGCVKLLIDHGAEVNAEDAYCGHVLNAARKGYKGPHNTIIQMLLDAGADETMVPDFGELDEEDTDSDIILSYSGDEDYYDRQSEALSGEE